MGPGEMIMQTFSRCGIGLCLVILIAGCSSVETRRPDQATTGAGRAAADNGCLWGSGRCQFEGSYEPGEAGYAEAEARRLNQAQLERLRRHAW